MRFKIFLVWTVIMFAAGIAYAFTNSLDGSSQNNQFSSDNHNNFSAPKNNSFQNNVNQPFNPKEHAGFQHQDRNFNDPSLNDTRYNSSCQFGTCTPGGLNSNNR